MRERACDHRHGPVASLGYTPRDATRTVVHWVVREHLESFLATTTRADPSGLPTFLEQGSSIRTRILRLFGSDRQRPQGTAVSSVPLAHGHGRLQFPGAGTCVDQPRPCFGNQIARTGVCGTEQGELVSTLCVPAIAADAINAMVGLPGPGAIRLPVAQVRSVR